MIQKKDKKRKCLKNFTTKVGILGGGQLGKMLCLAAGNWDLNTFVMDKDSSLPAVNYCKNFIKGDITNYDDVYNFGKLVDVLTIEIEHVNINALFQLEKEGLQIHPNPTALSIIQDKLIQKEFYLENNLPSSDFKNYKNKRCLLFALDENEIKIPFVQKSRQEGYDGKGVVVVKKVGDLKNLLDASCIVEPLVDIFKEVSVIASKNSSGEIVTFPMVDMDFHESANLVEYLVCPTSIHPKLEHKAQQIAKKIIKKFDICGVLAVEFFITNDDAVLINEVAPRPHNSGHHTIDSTLTSQFQQHLRGILNWPLGNTKSTSYAVMLNLLGEPKHNGSTFYKGMNDAFQMEGVNVHLYGKKETRPFRKMGHVTIVSKSKEDAYEKAIYLKSILKVVASND